MQLDRTAFEKWWTTLNIRPVSEVGAEKDATIARLSRVYKSMTEQEAASDLEIAELEKLAEKNLTVHENRLCELLRSIKDCYSVRIFGDGSGKIIDGDNGGVPNGAFDSSIGISGAIAALEKLVADNKPPCLHCGRGYEKKNHE